MLLFILLSYTVPLDSPIMENIEYLQLRGFFDVPSLRPHDAQWIISQLDDLLIKETTVNDIDRRIISYFSPLLTKNPSSSYLLHVAGAYQSEPEIYGGILDGRIGGRIIPRVEYAHGTRFSRANELDSLGPKPWNDFQVYLDEGLIRLDFDRIMFDFGRRNFLLGPGDTHSLLFSPGHQSYDGFSLQVPGRYFEFSGIFSVLDATESRFVSIHRLGLNLKRFLKIGFSEAILFSGSLEPMYLNFFLPYYLAQWGSDRNEIIDDNVMWSFDFQLQLFNSILYAELLIDDYMYEDDPYPDKLAYQVGLKSLVWQTLIAKINYTSVDKWVYTHETALNVYERRGRCLGFPLGNDVDQVSFSLRYENKYGVRPHLTIDYSRKGEGSVYVPYEDEGGSINPPFPSGVVERTLQIKCGIDYTYKTRFHIKSNIGQLYKYNEGHNTNNDRDELLFSMGLWVIL
ncbi:hypothetical protein AMJ83_05355 [candidate division WOR_3 bacterium SM23_42]|uniref:Capsule assembly Wzi family protein n=1 Tax=candidate division WOR_3 bacterium SM23_42 TaxID=1703779 RepID=A0A0S8FT22_UNCW3|nr:MAG: hypothetical protein AMJ83_05355 [candidate division WOR_3 bacterium SM23_42]